ncbi:unnamed protein product [Protopolystoma xenopodis]|uniref:Uncharacterized protein n=1 Tax=Protopolystoma xenopodis TaxID=117903 RepID=A0A448WZE1_9PLAT|nr:unnamed protein product [Protopolystoma xenopodis]
MRAVYQSSYTPKRGESEHRQCTTSAQITNGQAEGEQTGQSDGQPLGHPDCRMCTSRLRLGRKRPTGQILEVPSWCVQLYGMAQLRIDTLLLQLFTWLSQVVHRTLTDQNSMGGTIQSTGDFEDAHHRLEREMIFRERDFDALRAQTMRLSSEDRPGVQVSAKIKAYLH